MRGCRSQHDCRNNVEFVFGQQDMRFRAIEDIQPNEEIFTHYGQS